RVHREVDLVADGPNFRRKAGDAVSRGGGEEDREKRVQGWMQGRFSRERSQWIEGAAFLTPTGPECTSPKREIRRFGRRERSDRDSFLPRPCWLKKKLLSFYFR